MVTEEEAAAGWREYLAKGDVAGGRGYLAGVVDRDAPPSHPRALVRDDRDASVTPLHMQAVGARLLGRYEESRTLYEESLELNRARGDARMTAIELHNLAHVALHLGDVDEAEERLEEWRLLVAASDDPYDLAMQRLNDAALAIAHGEPGRARALLDEAEERLAAAGIVLDPDDASELHHLRALSG